MMSTNYEQVADEILDALQPVLKGTIYTYNGGGTVESGTIIDPIAQRRKEAREAILKVLRY